METRYGVNEMFEFVARVGFPVPSDFSCNGFSKYEYYNIRVEASNTEEAYNKVSEGYADLNVIIEQVSKK
jgi:hypothetical protein